MEVTKIDRFHPLGNMNIVSKSHSDPPNRSLDECAPLDLLTNRLTAMVTFTSRAKTAKKRHKIWQHNGWPFILSENRQKASVTDIPHNEDL